MPELPEVETTRRGVEPHVVGRRIASLALHERRLRWPVERDLPARVTGTRITAAGRRAKYLLFTLDSGATLMLHLGMSGSLRVLPADTPRKPHDHLDLVLDSGQALRFNDPRRFGSLHLLDGDPECHPLLAKLAPEPFDAAFDADYLWRATRGRRVAIKQLIMNSQLVVGVGNIYASEALFRAGIRPGTQARRVSRARMAALAASIREVLSEAITVGGTTLRDYVNPDGLPGYFRQRLFVYERADEPCRRCRAPIRHTVMGQRSTYWCPICQT
jgi:formamidopyrimidine-DNA glycosylase